MTTEQTKPLSPTNLNAVEPYARRYLNTASDWKHYLGSDLNDFPARAETITAAYFGSQALKGAAVLLGTHLLQQLSASFISLGVQGWLKGRSLGAYRGITIWEPQGLKRRSSPDSAWQKQLELFRCLSTSGKRGQRGRLHQVYYFTEAGRTWLCYTLHINFEAGERYLSVLTLLGAPNRSYYFDRPLLANEAIALTQNRLNGAGVAGFIGQTNELDFILPVLRLLKLGIYALNWYLVTPDERDAGPPPLVSGYNNILPPDKGGSGSKSNPFSVKSSQRRRRHRSNAPRSPYSNVGSYYGEQWYGASPPPPPPLPPTPPWPQAGYGAVQSSFLPQGPGAILSPASVKILVGEESGDQQGWVMIDDGAWLVLDRYNQPTGLAVTPLLSKDENSRWLTADNSWHVVHVETGRTLTDIPLTNLNLIRQLVTQLTQAIDWKRPFSQLSPQDIERARTILARYTTPYQNGNRSP